MQLEQAHRHQRRQSPDQPGQRVGIDGLDGFLYPLQQQPRRSQRLLEPPEQRPGHREPDPYPIEVEK